MSNLKAPETNEEKRNRQISNSQRMSTLRTSDHRQLKQLNNAMRMSNTRNEIWRQKENSAFSYDSNIVHECDPLIEIGRMVTECSFCKALKWKGESISMCRNNVKIQLPLSQTPPEPLLSLLSTNSPGAINFQSNIRRHNSCFQMTSFGSGRKLENMYAKIETERLRFIRLNQKKLRVEDYIYLKDAINNDDNIKQIGKSIILPSTFTGSPRCMHKRTENAMAYVRNYGSPHLFITFTCNPKWREITEELISRQKRHDRHDIICRVFYLKLKSLINLINKGKIFGEIRCFIYTIEWQKRGLPHARILLWFQENFYAHKVDDLITAELPNPETDPILYNVVKTRMIHGPCGNINPLSPCMKDGKCTKIRVQAPLETTLTAFFSLCQSDEFARSLLYHQVPKYYTWNKRNKKWVPRKSVQAVPDHPGIKSSDALGYVYTVHPSNSECFHLRLLLHEVIGQTSFSDLKTFNGIVSEIFKQACKLRRLLEDDSHWKSTLDEAATTHSGRMLRDLYAVILHTCCVSNPIQLWNLHRENKSEDILHKARITINNMDLDYSDEIFNGALFALEDKIKELGGTD
ncbi:hypothetical protein HNY73_003507 [Argiope bruennichi]|uniref:Helitron helicase-like domain-containing protein n=1 Tax=Argiope bruennichi TaxID=94029 RepID=A0A8T0FLQ4_ARGBR|nr:hypothetical protein HNY73_003507 [Argiope bruennichi]